MAMVLIEYISSSYKALTRIHVASNSARDLATLKTALGHNHLWYIVFIYKFRRSAWYNI